MQLLMLTGLLGCTPSGGPGGGPTDSSGTAGPGDSADSAVAPDTGDTVDSGGAPPPTLVVVVLDTARWQLFDEATMPRLFARRSSGLLVNVVAGVAAWTLPTTTALMTGQRLESFGLTPEDKTIPPGTLYGLPHAFRDAGWYTLLDAANVVVSGNLHEGFTDEVSDSYTVDFATQADEVLARLDAAPATQPRFVWVQSMSLHVPYDRLDPSCEAAAVAADDACPVDVLHPVGEGYAGGAFDGLDAAESAACATAVQVAQRCAATRVDDELDDFLAALPPDALVVVTADHGEGWLDPYVEHNWGTSPKLTRTFMLLLHPSLAGEGVSLGSQLDLAPTLLAFAGLSTAGLTLEGTALGEPAAAPPTSWFCDGHGNSEVAAWSDTYQVLRSQKRKVGLHYSLFDLTADPMGDVDVSATVALPADLVAAADALYASHADYCPAP